MRATIRWSYDLLSTAEQALFRRLSLFVRGFSLDAVEAMMAGGVRSAAIPRPARLISKPSIGRRVTAGPRPRSSVSGIRPN